MSGDGRERLEGYLREQDVSFKLIEHAHTETAAAEAQVAHLPAEQTAKTVVLHTPSGYRFAVLAASDRLDLHKAADALDVARHQLRLASEDDMASDFAAYEVGAVPPMGPDTPAELIDARLLGYQHVLCSAGDHEHSLVVDPTDIVRVTGARTADLRQD
jgi:prolyl-tRNA editing enzyme YbaK/EbsC (Cys-tRNA(Pro) deacylase)